MIKTGEFGAAWERVADSWVFRGFKDPYTGVIERAPVEKIPQAELYKLCGKLSPSQRVRVQYAVSGRIEHLKKSEQAIIAGLKVERIGRQHISFGPAPKKEKKEPEISAAVMAEIDTRYSLEGPRGRFTKNDTFVKLPEWRKTREARRALIDSWYRKHGFNPDIEEEYRDISMMQRIHSVAPLTKDERGSYRTLSPHFTEVLPTAPGVMELCY